MQTCHGVFISVDAVLCAAATFTSRTTTNALHASAPILLGGRFSSSIPTAANSFVSCLFCRQGDLANKERWVVARNQGEAKAKAATILGCEADKVSGDEGSGGSGGGHCLLLV